MEQLSTPGYVVITLLVLFAFRGAVSFVERMYSTDPFCSTCGHKGAPKYLTRGNIWTELVLWCCFLVPGMIYSLWRRSSSSMVCSNCSAGTLMSGDSPAAQKMRKEWTSEYL